MNKIPSIRHDEQMDSLLSAGSRRAVGEQPSAERVQSSGLGEVRRCVRLETAGRSCAGGPVQEAGDRGGQVGARQLGP